MSDSGQCLKAAQVAVDAVDAQITALQAELHNASPAEKAFIIREIKRLRTEELPEAMAILEDARRALQDCRDRRSPILDTRGTIPNTADASQIGLMAEGNGRVYHESGRRDPTEVTSR